MAAGQPMFPGLSTIERNVAWDRPRMAHPMAAAAHAQFGLN